MNKEINIFETAVRNKFRFDFRGLQSVESLWDLSVRDLDSIFKTLNSQVKQIKEESLLDTKTQQNEELDVKIEIVKYIVKTKLEEEQLRNDSKNKKQKKQELYELLESKKNENLKGKSEEEIQKMIDELDS